MENHAKELIPLDRRLQELKGSIAADLAIDVGGATGTALASLGGPIAAILAAGFCGFAVFMRGRAGQGRMLEALESIQEILKKHQMRIDELGTPNAKAQTDATETAVAKFLEVSAREESQEKIRVARNYLENRLNNQASSLRPSTTDEEFERWLKDATTLEVQAVLALKKICKTTDLIGRFPQNTYPTRLDKVLACDRDTASRIADSLRNAHIVAKVRQIPEGSQAALSEGEMTGAYALTELGAEFQRRMISPSESHSDERRTELLRAPNRKQ